MTQIAATACTIPDAIVAISGRSLAPRLPSRRSRGGCTGPRTPAGFASLAAAPTAHGGYAPTRPDPALPAETRRALVLLSRSRLHNAAFDLLSWLPTALAAQRNAGTASELRAPIDRAPLRAGPHFHAFPNQPCEPRAGHRSAKP